MLKEIQVLKLVKNKNKLKIGCGMGKTAKKKC